jgi:hypothetical protein
LLNFQASGCKEKTMQVGEVLGPWIMQGEFSTNAYIFEKHYTKHDFTRLLCSYFWNIFTYNLTLGVQHVA